MADTINDLRAGFALALGAISAALGWFGWLILLYVGSMAVDWITGSAAAMRAEEWSSKKARDGIWHKFGSIVVVMVAIMADMMIGSILKNIPGITLPIAYEVMISPVVLVWYIATELGSIIENAVKMGAPVPKFLRKAVSMLHEVTDAAGENLLPTDKERE